MIWIYLSPHPDDVVFSCGGFAWEQVQRGEAVEIWTICAGDPPSSPQELTPFALELHQRWQTGSSAGQLRRQEDEKACQRLGVRYLPFSIPDCIYRRRAATGEAVIRTVEDLFNLKNEPEPELFDSLGRQFCALLPADAILVSPMTLGGHIDHRLTRRVAEHVHLAKLFYYADFPYVLEGDKDLINQIETEFRPFPGEISSGGLQAWQDAATAYTSQISTFWSDEDEMRDILKQYWVRQGGCLWQRRDKTEVIG